MDKADLKQDKKMIGSMINKHEKKMHPGKSMTKFAKGGVTTDAMKSMGRNLARVANQGGK
jgi:hypothetical protein